MIISIIKKIKFDLNADRLGPDCLFTHFRLAFKPLMRKLCEQKFGGFGKGSEFRPGAYAVTCSKIYLGDNVVIRPSCMLFAHPDASDFGKIFIESNVMLGSGVHIYVSNHRYDQLELDIIEQGHSEPKSVTIKRGAWLGANVIILPGVTVGENAVVGAGSVVTKDVVSNTIVCGNPAKYIKQRC